MHIVEVKHRIRCALTAINAAEAASFSVESVEQTLKSHGAIWATARREGLAARFEKRGAN